VEGGRAGLACRDRPRALGLAGPYESAPADDELVVREILLPRALDISVVRTIATEISHALATGPLALDASAVAKVDACGLQLLCAAMAMARATGQRVSWKSVPAALLEGARTLALVETLGLPHERTEIR
jgi:anti-anti-sigma regulatory factor